MRNLILRAAVLAVAAAAVAVPAMPAFASGPPAPPGCTFDQTTGVLTCRTTTTTTSTIGPFSTNDFVPLNTTFDGVTGQQMIQATFDDTPCIAIFLNDATFDATFTTTTTTERHGLEGHVFDTSTSTSLTSLIDDSPGVGCQL